MPIVKQQPLHIHVRVECLKSLFSDLNILLGVQMDTWEGAPKGHDVRIPAGVVPSRTCRRVCRSSLLPQASASRDSNFWMAFDDLIDVAVQGSFRFESRQRR